MNNWNKSIGSVIDNMDSEKNFHNNNINNCGDKNRALTNENINKNS